MENIVNNNFQIHVEMFNKCLRWTIIYQQTNHSKKDALGTWLFGKNKRECDVNNKADL